MTKEQQIAAIRKLAKKIGGSFRNDYSGRMMFGRTCYAVDCNDLTEALMAAGKLKLPRPSTDQMGKGYVIYWPEISIVKGML